ncbi:melanocortin-2 receptor accessory protein 2-like [Narcine bancroftii]|uniref:melanocortin-2 receptor accessory protein 2-like n=1 Tax=Narcine bancroftii TaxID=1343680 RepID=UPI0038310987
MSEDSPAVNKSTVSNNDYIWGYEYYDYEPVSFEGLKAHRYSIVIGFWVGLAVFVLFMFFMFTLLSKTGEQHQSRNLDLTTNQQRANSLTINYLTCKKDKAFCHHSREESRSPFHFCGNEVPLLERPLMVRVSDLKSSDLARQDRNGRSDSTNNGIDCISKCDIPNCVSLDHSSSLNEEDLLKCKQPIILDNKADRLQIVHKVSD